MYRYNKLKQAEQSILKLTMIYECFLVSGFREKDLIRIGKKLHIITHHSYEKGIVPRFWQTWQLFKMEKAKKSSWWQRQQRWKQGDR